MIGLILGLILGASIARLVHVLMEVLRDNELEKFRFLYVQGYRVPHWDFCVMVGVWPPRRGRVGGQHTRYVYRQEIGGWTWRRILG